MAAGSIVVDLLLRSGSFSSDTDRAAKELKKFQRQAEEAGKVIGVALVAGITLAVAAFDTLVKGAADFKDFEETIGASAEDIASLAVAAATAGVGMESVTGATIKLTKGLTGVDDESKAAGAALAALGLNIEDFKRLDPVAQYEAVGKALAGFADGAQKTAVAVALFGKSGAEQLRVFKALEEAGGRQVILTQQQIELADAYADSQSRNAAVLKLYAQAAATEFLPALNDVTIAAKEFAAELLGIDSAGKGLSSGHAIRDFADSLATGFAFVVDQIDLVVRLFQIAGKGIAGFAATSLAVQKGEFKEALNIAREAAKDIEDVFNRQTFGDKLRSRMAVRNSPDSNAAASYNRTSNLPQVNFKGPEKDVKDIKDKTTEADRYIDALQKQVQKTEELTEVEKVLDDIVKGRFENAKAGQANQALALADELDRGKLLEKQNKELVEIAEQQEKASERLREAGKSVFDATRTPAEQYAIELKKLNDLYAAGAVNADTYQRGVLKLQDQFDENAKRIKEIAQSINSSFEGAFANAFGDFVSGAANAKDAFKSFANSVIQDLIRIAAQDFAKSLFKSGSDNSQGLGAILSRLFGSGSGSAGSGSASGGFPSDFGASSLAVGTNYVPYDGFKATLHKGEAVQPAKYNPINGASGSKIQVVNPPGMPQTAEASTERQPDGTQLIKLVLSAVQQDFKNGGGVSQAAAGTFGLRRQLPRRGT